MTRTFEHTRTIFSTRIANNACRVTISSTKRPERLHTMTLATVLHLLVAERIEADWD